MLHYKRFLFLLNNDKCVFIKKKLHEKNNTAISHVAFFNHLDLQHQFKRFNSQNPNGPNWVPFVFFVKNILFFFSRTVRCIFFFFLIVKSMKLLMHLFNVLSKIFRAKAISHRSGPNWGGDLTG